MQCHSNLTSSFVQPTVYYLQIGTADTWLRSCEFHTVQYVTIIAYAIQETEYKCDIC